MVVDLGKPESNTGCRFRPCLAALVLKPFPAKIKVSTSKHQFLNFRCFWKWCTFSAEVSAWQPNFLLTFLVLVYLYCLYCYVIWALQHWEQGELPSFQPTCTPLFEKQEKVHCESSDAQSTSQEAKWSGKDNATLIKVLTDQQAAGNQSDNGWKHIIWQAAMEKPAGSKFVSGCALKTVKRCHSHWDTVCHNSLVIFTLYYL